LTQLVQIRWDFSPYTVVPPCLFRNAEAVLAYVRPVLHVSSNDGDGDRDGDTGGSSSDVTYALAHKEIREWLVNLPRDLSCEFNDNFSLDLPRAHLRLAAFLIKKVLSGPSEKLVKHILSSGSAEVVPPLDILLRSTSEPATGALVHLDSFEYPLSVEEVFRLVYHLVEAAEGGACSDPLHLLETMIASDASHPSPNDLFALALRLAVRRAQDRVMRLLLKILLEKQFNLQPTLLFAISEAARKNLTSILSSLLDELDISKCGANGRFEPRVADALVIAAEQGHSECCGMLLHRFGPELVLAQPSSSSVTSLEAVVARRKSTDEGCLEALILLLDVFCKVLSMEPNSVLCRVRDAVSALEVSGFAGCERLVKTINRFACDVDEVMSS